MPVNVELLEVEIGPMFTENCYIVSDAPDATQVIVVDPGAQAARILAAIGDRTVESIVLTHRHFDHTGALEELARTTGARIIAHRLDAEAISDPYASGAALEEGGSVRPSVTDIVDEGDEVRIGSVRFSVISTPGHTVGSMCLYDGEGGVLISGDTLFYEEVGRTDLPTGSAAQQRESLRKLAQLPEQTVVYPGHDAITTIGHEIQHGYLGAGR
jgi:glyoxylase-like metal-dependent hydrolase (beta-lactamase superfamily II)